MKEISFTFFFAAADSRWADDVDASERVVMRKISRLGDVRSTCDTSMTDVGCLARLRWKCYTRKVLGVGVERCDNFCLCFFLLHRVWLDYSVQSSGKNWESRAWIMQDFISLVPWLFKNSITNMFKCSLHSHDSWLARQMELAVQFILGSLNKCWNSNELDAYNLRQQKKSKLGNVLNSRWRRGVEWKFHEFFSFLSFAVNFSVRCFSLFFQFNKMSTKSHRRPFLARESSGRNQTRIPTRCCSNE